MAVLIGDEQKDRVVGSIYLTLIFIAVMVVFGWINMRDRSNDSAHIERAKQIQKQEK